MLKTSETKKSKRTAPEVKNNQINVHGSSLKNLSKKGIQVLGAREHNLKNIDVFIPRNKITLVTGLSGSGKSTLAFDTLYAEGQRRYLESLSVYAKYFIDKMKRPKVDFIYGLSPSIAINQKTISFNPRSTLGTLTETYDFLRLLYVKIGEVSCPIHKEPLKSQTSEEITHEIGKKVSKNSSIYILSPIARGKKGEFSKEFDHFLSLGFDQAKVDGEWKDIGKIHKLAKKKEHNIDILIDCIPRSKGYQERISKAVLKALEFSGSLVSIENPEGLKKTYSLDFSCPYCDYSFTELSSKLFSFNSPQGACSLCNGTGTNFLPLFYEEQNDGFYEEPKEDFKICFQCRGSRLRQETLQVKVKNLNIHQVSSMNIGQLKDFIKSLKFSGIKQQIVEKIKKPFLENLSFLQTLSLDYLSLNRSLSSLSGGEAQRVRLASQLSSSAIGVLYVLDEPSIGLHPKDHIHILKAVQKIRDRGNTVVIVEHDEESICKADKIIDLGPGAGIQGGFLIAEGTVSEIKKHKKSLTGAYLSKRKSIPCYGSRYKKTDPVLRLTGLKENNLKNLNMEIPLSCLVGVSGVSGSGKSSLVTDTIYPLLANNIYKKPEKKDINSYSSKSERVGIYSKAYGMEQIKRVLQINQKPIGRSPRSNPVTYIGVFQMIRFFFSQLPESRMRGYTPGSFSFNVPGGRCENCKGMGAIKLEMRFLPDVFTMCDICNGKKYTPEILDVTYKGRNIYDILNMSVAEAEEFFKNHPYIHRRLKFLKDVGLSYLKLGQSSSTLSGGEAQRIKLSRELVKKTQSHSFYILDEPTTGLHFQDVELLLNILRQFVKQGHTVLIIEHHLDILKSCDYLIDLGPEGGEKGGYIVAQGTPREVSKNSKSWTGQYLKPYFN